ncbi:hypothetical protein [Stomatohabitans albus]|uniref:hypothetical protein n=1 Tax=Stomatohabitans albus TaxID=3110766 RepID=UPI00300D1789
MDPIVLFGDVNLYWLIAAAAGGLFGAAIGGNIAFGFTGITILLGLAVATVTDSSYVIDFVAFGPIFGPHISFAGGAAAAAYAAKKGYLETGRDLNTPLVSLDKPDVLLVGAGFGVLGYLIKAIVSYIPYLGEKVDAVALTVLLSGLIARAMFSSTPVAKWAATLDGDRHWVPWQERPGQVAVLSVGSSVLAIGIAMYLVQIEGINPALAGFAPILPFALSAICIILLVLGANMPVTHHITLTSALGAVTYLPIVGGNMFVALVIGVIFGLIAGFGAEFVQRLFYANGDTHIDPPAGIIWFNTFLILVSASFFA